MKLRYQILEASREHAQAHIEKHRLNVEIYLTNPVGVGNASAIMDSIEHELEEMAKYQDIVEIIDAYFSEE